MLTWSAVLCLVVPNLGVGGLTAVRGGFAWGLGNRDQPFDGLPAWAGRARRAHANLVENLSLLGSFDVIVCRYVLDGLTDVARARATAQLADMTAPGGLLLLGGAEALEQAGFAPAGDVAGAFTRAA